MTGVQVWGFSGVHQQVPFFWQRTCDLCSLRQGFMQSWTVAASKTVSLLQVERTQGYTPQQNFASFLPPVGLYTLVLSHSLCSKLHESKSSLYPSP